VSRFLEAVLPSLGVLLFFAIGLRALVHADRRERAAAAQYERAQDAAAAERGGPGTGAAADSSGRRRAPGNDDPNETGDRALPTDRP
jgi:hypothetical protein